MPLKSQNGTKKMRLPPCPICSGRMRWTTGPYGKFLGCKKWPRCTGKRPKGAYPGFQI